MFQLFFQQLQGIQPCSEHSLGASAALPRPVAAEGQSLKVVSLEVLLAAWSSASPAQPAQPSAAQPGHSEVLLLCPYQQNTSSSQPSAHTLISCSRGAFTAAEGSRGLPRVSQDGCHYFPDHRDPREYPASVLMEGSARSGGRKPFWPFSQTPTA